MLVVTIDTLRPDAFGWVSGGSSSPHIDRLAATSLRLPAAVSPVPLTLPAHTSLFTGLDPPRHGVRTNGHVLRDAVPTLAERLRAAGYRTAAFVSGFPLRAMFGLDRGFEHYDDRLATGGDTTGERAAAATTAAALAWLDRAAPASPRWFLWVHYYEPHAPYEPPGGAPPADTRAAYLGEVATVDAAVGDLLAGVARRRPGELRLTVITADHGESLGEHGEDTHGFFAYDSTLLVPALWHLPGRIEAGDSKAPARLVDFAPTVLDLVGAPPIPGIDGISLRPLLDGKPLEVPAAYVETLKPWLGYGWAPLVGVRTAAAKLIVAPRPELYDLADDPGEAEDRYAADPETASRLRRLLRERQALPPGAASAPPSAEAIAALRALGYTGGMAAGSRAVPPPGLADPKDRLRQRALLELAEEAIRSGAVDEGLATFDVVLASEPDNRHALLRLGQVLLEQEQPRAAERPLARLLRLDPEHPEAHFALADALSRSGETARAVAQWRALLAVQPRRAAAWSNLGTLLVGMGELETGRQALSQAHALAPDNPTFRANLGACHLQLAAAAAAKGEMTQAREQLARALTLDGALARVASANPRLAPLVDARPERGAAP